MSHIEKSVINIDQILIKMNADHPGDIIADILHWCDANDEDFDDLVGRGRSFHQDEKAEEDSAYEAL
jgi:hypothetical protein